MANPKRFSEVEAATLAKIPEVAEIIEAVVGDVVEVASEAVSEAVSEVASEVAKPANAPEPMRTVTPETDLRVVTKEQVVLYLYGGQPRQLALSISYEAIRCAAEQGIELKVE